MRHRLSLFSSLGVEQLKGFFIDFHWYQSSQGTLFSLKIAMG
jgi:hypothetical protein